MTWLDTVAALLTSLAEQHEEFKCIIYGYKRGGERKVDVEPIPRVKVQ